MPQKSVKNRIATLKIARAAGVTGGVTGFGPVLPGAVAGWARVAPRPSAVGAAGGGLLRLSGRHLMYKFALLRCKFVCFRIFIVSLHAEKLLKTQRAASQLRYWPLPLPS